MRPTSLAFITPVWQRFSLTGVCLRQRKHVCDHLKDHYGLDATTIVVGSDENLDVAESMGFETVRHENWARRLDVNRGEPYVALGMKFNAGYMKANELGIDLVFPIGSDSWIHPAYFSELPDPGELLLSRAYNLVTADTRRRGALWIGWEGGVQWITWTKDWAHRDFKPVSESLSKGCDTSTWVHRRPDIRVGEKHIHQLEYVAFQSPANQITDYAAIMHRYGIGEAYDQAVFGDLEGYYDAEDIRAVKVHYNRERIATIEETLRLMRDELGETAQLYEELQREREELEATA